jgi:hypothetical protein
MGNITPKPKRLKSVFQVFLVKIVVENFAAMPVVCLQSLAASAAASFQLCRRRL